MSDHVFYLVFSNPVSADRVDEFNRWYDEQHIPDVLSVPGMVSAQRLTYHEMSAAMGAPPARFGVIYEMDGDPEDVMGTIRERVASGQIVMSDVLDLSTFAMHFWDAAGEKVLASTVRAGA